ncbi:hypothetical protein ACFL2J_00635 [Candidatus Omnitrophota bacterium]
MAAERLSRLQKQILRSLLEISLDFKERGLLRQDDMHYEGFPSLSIPGYLTSRVSDRYYDKLFRAGGVGARYLKNVVISRKASVAISRSLRSLHKKGLVVLYEISEEARLTSKGAEAAKSFIKI